MEIERGRTIEMQGRRVKCKREREREREREMVTKIWHQNCYNNS
jgi:hypothetical protein